MKNTFLVGLLILGIVAFLSILIDQVTTKAENLKNDYIQKSQEQNERRYKRIRR